MNFNKLIIQIPTYFNSFLNFKYMKKKLVETRIQIRLYIMSMCSNIYYKQTVLRIRYINLLCYA